MVNLDTYLDDYISVLKDSLSNEGLPGDGLMKLFLTKCINDEG